MRTVLPKLSILLSTVLLLMEVAILSGFPTSGPEEAQGINMSYIQC